MAITSAKELLTEFYIQIVNFMHSIIGIIFEQCALKD